jgi:hypothetical protein
MGYGEKVLASDISSFNLSFYDSAGNTTTTESEFWSPGSSDRDPGIVRDVTKQGFSAVLSKGLQKMKSAGPTKRTFIKATVEDEQGNALLAALMVSMLLAVLALSMSSNITTDFSMSHDLESQKRALQTADTGNSVLKNSLLGSDLSTAL